MERFVFLQLFALFMGAAFSLCGVSSEIASSSEFGSCEPLAPSNSLVDSVQGDGVAVAAGSEPRELKKSKRRGPRKPRPADGAAPGGRAPRAGRKGRNTPAGRHHRRRMRRGRHLRRTGPPGSAAVSAPATTTGTTPGSKKPVYVRYRASIRDPRNFFLSHVKFDSEVDGDNTVYLYFKKPLSDKDVEGLRQGSSVDILDPVYVSVNSDDMSKLDAGESKSSWIYDEVEHKFYRFRTTPAVLNRLNGAGHRAPRRRGRRSRRRAAAAASGASSGASSGYETGEGDVADPASAMDSQFEGSGGVDVSPQGAIDADQPSAVSADQGGDALGAPEGLDNGALSPMGEADASAQLDQIGGSPDSPVAEEGLDPGLEPGLEAEGSSPSQRRAMARNRRAIRRRRQALRLRRQRRNRRAPNSTGSYTLVDDLGNPVADRSAYAETLNDEIASYPAVTGVPADGTPTLTSYKQLNEDGDVINVFSGEPVNMSPPASGVNGNVSNLRAGLRRRRSKRQSPVWPPRRIQNEVIRTKKRVTNLEKRLVNTEGQLNEIVRI